MSAGVFAIVLFAAFLHAFWNALVKGAGDKAIALGLIALGHVIPGLGMVMIAPLPGAEAVPYIIASTVIHWLYYWLLNAAYRLGDLSLVYPIARGLAPVLIALGAQIWVGEHLPPLAWGGILAVSLGIMMLTRGVLRSGLPMPGLLAAIGVALTISAYSIADGVGVRVSASVLGYVGWLFVSEIFVVGYVFKAKWARLCAAPPRVIVVGVLGGLISGAAYGLVLYTKTLAPLGLVSALRETSVIFAALIGVIWFHERPWRDRIIAACVVAAGVAVIAAV